MELIYMRVQTELFMRKVSKIYNSLKYESLESALLSDSLLNILPLVCDFFRLFPNVDFGMFKI